MSPVAAMTRRLTHPAMALGVQVAEPLTRSSVGTRVLRTGIWYERHLRGHQRQATALVKATTGYTTTGQRRRARELADRHAMTPGRPVKGHGVPAVHWHGPDRVAPGRPVVVLINGWTASGVLWPSGLVAELERDHEVIRIDNRGSGWSRTAPAPFTIARLADDVVDVLDAVGARSATLVGLSMGGMIAQETASRHPERVDRLVLCGTRPAAPLGFLPASNVLAPLLAAPAPGQPIRDYMAAAWRRIVGPGFATRDHEAMAEMIDLLMVRLTPHAGVITQMRAIASWHGADRIGRLDVPTTVIHGTEDVLIPVGNGMRLAQLIPGAEYVELPGVGHIVPFEAPDAVLAATTGRT
jgi:3-oxoadipate enol-lactonase